MPLTFSTLSSATTVGCTITLLGCTNAGVSGFFKSLIKILPFSPEPCSKYKQYKNIQNIL